MHSKLNEENECLKSKKLVCDVSLSTEDLNLSCDECIFAEVVLGKECETEGQSIFENTKFANCDIDNKRWFEQNVGFKIMKKKGL